MALTLERCSIPVMPLKGAFFQLFLYADPAARLISDLDVLVPEPCFERATSALLDAGFHAVKAGKSLVEVTLLSPRGFPVDLHRRLFSRGRYRLATADVFRRARFDRELIGAPLALAHPLDTAAHLVGKLASDHVVEQAEARLEELVRLCEHYALDAVALAHHLERAGLSRAAWYALSLAREHHRCAFFERLARALPEGPVTCACVHAARAAGQRYGEMSLAASASAHLLNTSLPAGALSLAWSAASRARHAYLSHARGRGGGALAPFFADG